jgi:hypothetical protein
MILGSFGSRRGIDARTTQSPAHRGASPQCADGGPNPSADAHSNAYYAAEVQSILKSARTSSVNLARITTGSPSPDIEFLAANSPLFERDAISLLYILSRQTEGVLCLACHLGFASRGAPAWTQAGLTLR